MTHQVGRNCYLDYALELELRDSVLPSFPPASLQCLFDFPFTNLRSKPFYLPLLVEGISCLVCFPLYAPPIVFFVPSSTVPHLISPPPGQILQLLVLNKKVLYSPLPLQTHSPKESPESLFNSPPLTGIPHVCPPPPSFESTLFPLAHPSSNSFRLDFFPTPPFFSPAPGLEFFPFPFFEVALSGSTSNSPYFLESCFSAVSRKSS